MSNLCVYGCGFLAQSIWNLLLAGVCMAVPVLIHFVIEILFLIKPSKTSQTHSDLNLTIKCPATPDGKKKQREQDESNPDQ